MILLLQDSPSVKSKYTASVSVPEGLKALMSANLESEMGEADQDRKNYRTYKFRQDVPIPSYLLALAVGNLESRKLGPRSKVVQTSTNHLYFSAVCIQQYCSYLYNESSSTILQRSRHHSNKSCLWEGMS